MTADQILINGINKMIGLLENDSTYAIHAVDSGKKALAIYAKLQKIVGAVYVNDNEISETEQYYQTGFAAGYDAAMKKVNEPAKVSDDSDALASPPNFEQMVFLIEKLFRDSLIGMKLGMPPDRIDKAWLRYKTLNHLYRDDVPAKETSSILDENTEGRV